MINYVKVDPMPEHWIKSAFKGKRKLITMVNTKYGIHKPMY